MKLNALLSEKLIELNATCKSKDDVLQKIASLAKESEILQPVDKNQIYQKLKNREAISTTGFGKSIAIPHCPIKGISDFVIGALVVPEGVDFAAVDDEPTRIFIFIILPQDQRNQHIRLLSKFANALKDKNNVKELLACQDKATFREIILRQTQPGVEKEQSEKYNVFNIIIQDEEVFDKVLHTLTQFEDCIPTILDSENVSSYLYKQPLFSGFYNEEEKEYSQLVLAVINESFVNDLIRQLNMILDDAQDDTRAFWVQEVFYCNGSINL